MNRAVRDAMNRAVRRMDGRIGGAIGVLGALIALAAPAFTPSALAAPLPPAPPQGAQPQKSTPHAPPQTRPEPAYTKVTYDSQLSVNDRCAVRQARLNPIIRPVYVNRQPVGFC